MNIETDEVLVNRNDTTYTTTVEKMAELQDDDLMLVNRDSTTYKVTGKEIKDSLVVEIAPSINSVLLSQNQVTADRYTSNEFTSTVNYSQDPFPPASVEMTAEVKGALGLEAGTAPIVTNSYPGTSSNQVELELSSSTFLDDGTFEVGDVVKASESYTPTSSTIATVGPSPFDVYGYINGVQATNPLTYNGGTAYSWKDYEGYTTLEMPPSNAGIGNQSWYGYPRELTWASVIATNGKAVWGEFWYYDDGLGNPFQGNSWPLSTNFHYGYASDSQYVPFNATEVNMHARIINAGKGWHHIGMEMNPAHTLLTSYFDGELTNSITVNWNSESRQSIEYWNADYSGQTTIAPVAGIRINVDDVFAMPYQLTDGKYTPLPITAPFSEATAGVTHYIPVGGSTANVIELVDDTDIELFQVGDAVQKELPDFTGVKYIIGGNYNVPNFPGQGFNGDLSNRAQSNNSGPLGQNQIDMEFNPPLTGSNIKIKLATSSYRFYLNNDNTYSCSALDASATGIGNEIENGVIWNGDSTFDITNMTGFDGSLERLTFYQDPSQNYEQGIYGLIIDGSVQTLGYSSGADTPPVLVISTDVSAKTITVDSGNWDTSNQSEIWSNGVTLGPGNIYSDAGGIAYNATMAFDGLDSTNVLVEKGSSDPCTLILEPATGIPNVTKIRARVASVNQFRINNGGNIGTSTSAGWKDVYDGQPITLNKLEIERVTTGSDGSNTGFTLFEIEVNGQPLIDTTFNQYNWSDSSNAYDSPQNMFDGNVMGTTCVVEGTKTVFTASPFTAQTIETYQNGLNYTNPGNDWTIYINDIGYTGLTATQVNGATGWLKLDLGTPTLITKFEIEWTSRNNDTDAYSVNAVKADGKMMVDKRIFGDSNVTTVKPKQGQGTISSIANTQVFIEPYTDNCFKEGQHLIHATPKPILITPQSDEINTVVSDVLILDGDKDLLNFTNGDPVTMVNSDGSPAAYPAVTDSITGVGGVTGTIQIANDGSGYPAMWAIYLNDGSDNRDPGDAYVNANFGIQAYNNNNYNSDPNKLGNRGLYYTSMDNRYSYSGFAAGTEVMIIFGSAGSPGTQIRVSGDVEQNIQLDFNTQPKESNPKDFIKFKVSKESGTLIIGGTNIFIHYIDFFVNSPPVSATVLEFASDQNLEYYNVGDVVQGGTYRIEQPVGTPTTDSTIQGLFTGSGYSVSGRNTGNTEFFFDPPIPVNNTITFEANSNGDYGTLTCYDENNASIGSGSGGSYQYAERTISVSGLRYLRRITTTNGSIPSGDNPFNNTYRNFKVDGNFITVVDLNTLDYSVEVTNVSNIANNKVTVSGGSWNNGDTITKNISGTGTISNANPSNNTITLANSNNQWVAGYYVQTPEKPAIAQTGYLVFGSGGDVTGVTLAPQPAVVMLAANPILKFPAVFGTGQSPDTEMPYPTSLQTTITARNNFTDGTENSSTASSNVLYPAASTYVAPASGTRSYTTAGVAQLGANLQTFSGRSAAANSDPTDVQGAFTAAQTDINDYINGL